MVLSRKLSFTFCLTNQSWRWLSFSKSIWAAMFLFVFGFLSLASAWAQETAPQKVLFVGNSYTYFWNLPQQVATLAKSQEVSLHTFQSTSGGTNWGQHWRGDNGLKTRELIESGNFEAVVLQNHSMRSLEAPDSLMYFGSKFSELIAEKDAKVYLYMTWAREWDPFMQNPIKKAYLQLAQKTGAAVVPVGIAWLRARELRPDIDLYAEDGSHPSPLGTYLTACVFYKVLTGNSLQDIPSRLITDDKDGEKLYLNIISDGNAAFLQKVAEETVTAFSTSRTN